MFWSLKFLRATIWNVTYYIAVPDPQSFIAVVLSRVDTGTTTHSRYISRWRPAGKSMIKEIAWRELYTENYQIWAAELDTSWGKLVFEINIIGQPRFPLTKYKYREERSNFLSVNESWVKLWVSQWSFPLGLGLGLGLGLALGLGLELGLPVFFLRLNIWLVTYWLIKTSIACEENGTEDDTSTTNSELKKINSWLSSKNVVKQGARESLEYLKKSYFWFWVFKALKRPYKMESPFFRF